MKENGLVTLEVLQMENLALKDLSSEIHLQLSELSKKMKGEKRFGDQLSQRNAALVLRARIKSNGRINLKESFESGSS